MLVDCLMMRKLLMLVCCSWMVMYRFDMLVLRMMILCLVGIGDGGVFIG